MFVGNPEFNPFFSDCLTLCSFLAALFSRNDIESLFYAIIFRILPDCGGGKVKE